jgi:type IV secretion system protein VirB10
MTVQNVMQPAGDGSANPEEEGISPVTLARKHSLNTKAYLSLGVAAAVLAALIALLVSRLGAQHRQESAQRASANGVGTAASAGAQPLRVTAGAAPMPPDVRGLDPAGANKSGLPSGVVPGESDASLDAILGPFAASPRGAPLVRAQGDSSPWVDNRGVGPVSTGLAPIDPLDAPVLLTPAPGLQDVGRASGAGPGDTEMAQARAHLEETRARLEQILKGVSGGSAAGASQASAILSTVQEAGVKPSSTARVGASKLVAPALTLPRGASFTCALASKIVSEQTGPVSCVVSRNVYGSDGRVLLVERGSHLDGAYQAQVRVGQSRIAVLWERLRMPNGVVVDLASPATGALGESGVSGFVDNHWGERIGAALLLSLVDDAVKIEVAKEQSRGNSSGTVVLQGSGSETAALAGKVLDSTINIPPTIIKNQGEIVAVRVAHDVDFSSVYELRASALATGE